MTVPGVPLILVLDEELYAEEISAGFRPRYEGDAGIDLRCRDTTFVKSKESAALRLGVSVEIPPGHVGWMTGRSTTALRRQLLTHEGKIDAGYRGEVHAFVTALDGAVRIERGERIAQLVVVRIQPADTWQIAAELSSSHRSTSGLGSTGIR